MLEAGLDFGLRCTLMGHRNPRPEYGDGGSLAYRREELLKIAHPVSDALLQSYPFTAQLCYAFCTTQTIQYDSDFFFRAVLLTGLTFDIFDDTLAGR